MKTQIKILILLAAFLMAAGCRDKRMMEAFPAGQPVILKDDKENAYVVEHHAGETYTVKPIVK